MSTATDRATSEAKAAASSAAASAQVLAEDAQRTFRDAAKHFERAVQDGVEQIRAQSRAYADTAGDQIEEAQRYVVEHVRERPLAATGVAIGIGVVIGLLLAGGRR
ncbi:MAG: hypothetical protein MH112_08935 [Phenylobacterium sp.]|uniref:DUF883 C-terminal domain-containing protein n=1 Tax=Phenylobacterium sp. TaxID=1871053 RepID=UPI0025FEF86A|nr:DUF883 C-terminal domain-containing protein [Phenylobacterium sp.]MCG9916467.1 hypothetical protein [Phenylobacterium sp.]